MTASVNQRRREKTLDVIIIIMAVVGNYLGLAAAAGKKSCSVIKPLSLFVGKSGANHRLLFPWIQLTTVNSE